MSQNKTNYDSVIIGGSYAGLSAALALGRSLRKIIVIDAGLPCNRYAPTSQNFLTQDGQSPEEIMKLARNNILNYTNVDLVEDTAVDVINKGDSFTIKTNGGKRISAPTLLLATGMKDVFPGIEGFDACWGNAETCHL